MFLQDSDANVATRGWLINSFPILRQFGYYGKTPTSNIWQNILCFIFLFVILVHYHKLVNLYTEYFWIQCVCNMPIGLSFPVYFNCGGKFTGCPWQRNFYGISFLLKSHSVSIQVHFTYCTCIFSGNHILN